MYEKNIYMMMFLFSFCLVLCLSFIGNILSDYTISGAIVERLDSNIWAQQIKINIDGKNVSYYTENEKYEGLGNRKKEGYKLSNGRHSIYAYLNSVQFDTIYFIVNNDRYNFTFKYKKSKEGNYC